MSPFFNNQNLIKYYHEKMTVHNDALRERSSPCPSDRLTLQSLSSLV